MGSDLLGGGAHGAQGLARGEALGVDDELEDGAGLARERAGEGGGEAGGGGDALGVGAVGGGESDEVGVVEVGAG